MKCCKLVKFDSYVLCLFIGMTTLRELNISRCLKVTDAGIRHLLSIPTLEKLCIAETGITARGVTLLSSLKTLMFLDLGGLPVTDQALSSLQVFSFLIFWSRQFVYMFYCEFHVPFVCGCMVHTYCFMQCQRVGILFPTLGTCLQHQIMLDNVLNGNIK